MKTTPIALGLAAAVVLSATPSHAGRPVTLQERSQRTEAAQGLRLLVVENPRGWVHLRPSTDGQLHVSAEKICRAESHARVKQFAAETRVLAGREGDQYAVRVTYPRKVDIRISFWDLFKEENWSEGSLLPRNVVRLVLDVPAGLAVRVTSASGDIDSEGLAAAQVIQTASGDVGVRRSTGLVEVSTSSGDIEASEVSAIRASAASGDVFMNGVRGPMRVRTSSGDVTVNGALDSVTVRTSSGDVSIDDSPRALTVETSSGEVGVRSAAGRVQVSTANGDVEMRLRGPLAAASFQAASGDVRLDMAPGMDATFDVRSTSGEIEHPLRLQGERAGRGSLTGRIGRGGPLVRIETTNGDITLTGGGK